MAPRALNPGASSRPAKEVLEELEERQGFIGAEQLRERQQNFVTFDGFCRLPLSGLKSEFPGRGVTPAVHSVRASTVSR
jgi:hypothetical protein